MKNACSDCLMVDRLLLSFVELARAPQLRQLAARLHVTPATLSLRIKSLEDSLGVSLFGNEGQRLVLTAAGKRLLPVAESILNGYAELHAVAKHLSRDPERTVRLGVIESVVHTFLPQLLERFEQDLPEIKVDLSLDLTRNLLPQLMAGDVDLIICVGDAPLSAHLVVNDLLMFPVHWVVHPDSGLQGAALSKIIERRLFTQMVNTAPYHAVVAMLNSLASAGGEATGSGATVIGSPSLAMLVAMARKDLGVSIMPGVFVEEDLQAGSLVCLAQPSPRPSLISQHYHLNPTVATLAAAALVRRVCSDYIEDHRSSGFAVQPPS